MTSSAPLFERLAGALAGRYALVRELGRGGMATVYLAHDQRHEREVAIKVLHPELAESLGAERFLREIRLAAGLTHPHILPLFDSGTAAGALWYSMPRISGESLRERLAAGPLPIDEAVRVVADVAQALDYAHRQGVVHRDIKPENILLQDGHALVADFGIGKALSAVDGASVTRTGISIGTPAYMSPEQAAGDPVDGRSDVYSLGCVLYELLTGTPPFTGPNMQAVIAKRFMQTPDDVTALRAGVPRSVARALQTALQRTPIDRFEHARDFAEALRSADPASATGSGGPADRSVALLPFESLSRDPDDEFFADGVTEEILNALARASKLRVAGRSSSFAFKGRREDVRTVGATLGVATVLEGTMRRAGNRIRITATLTDARDGYQLWSERYERVLDDVFALQDEIAGAIAARLLGEFPAPPGAVRTASAPPTANLRAYESYLKGRALFYKRGRYIPAAIACFREALALDPDYAQPWAGLADALLVGAHGALFRPRDVMDEAIAAAHRAVSLAPESGEAHVSLATVLLTLAHDAPAAARHFARSLALDPNHPMVLGWNALWYRLWACDRPRDARVLLNRLLAIDPLSSFAHAMMLYLALTERDYDAAIEAGRRAVALDGESFLAQWGLAISLESKGDLVAAMEVTMATLALAPDHDWARNTRIRLLHRLGAVQEARAALDDFLATRHTRYRAAGSLANTYVTLGDHESAIAMVAEAVAERDPAVIAMQSRWPWLEPLKSHPRFVEVLRPLGLPAPFLEE